MKGVLVSPELRARIRGLVVPLARLLARLGFTPNALTLVGFGISAGAALLAAGGQWLPAGVVVIVGGSFDLLDGAVARVTGRVSRAGGFLDSVFDRWGEGLVLTGVAWGAIAGGHDRSALLAMLALNAAFMVSYTRARAEGLGLAPGTGMAAVGLAPREVRLVLLTAGLVAAGLLPAAGGPPPPALLALDLALAAIALLATVTTLQRIASTLARAAEEGNP